MAVAAYFARHAFMVGSDGAAQVSKPAMARPGPDGDGDGDGYWPHWDGTAATGTATWTATGTATGMATAMAIAMGTATGCDGDGDRDGAGTGRGRGRPVGRGRGLGWDGVGADGGRRGRPGASSPGDAARGVPVEPVALGQAGFVAWARFAASTITGCLVTRIESPARWGKPCWAVPCCRAAAGRTVASICSAVPGSVP